MDCIRILKDEDFGLKSIEFNNSRTRCGARGIVIRDDGKIAIFNKSNKNEYKLPGGSVAVTENMKIAGINISGTFTLLGHFRFGYMIPYDIVKNNIEAWKNQK